MWRLFTLISSKLIVCLIQTKQLSFQKLAKVAQTKKQIDRSNRLACGYSIIRAAEIHRFLGLSMLRQGVNRGVVDHVTLCRGYVSFLTEGLSFTSASSDVIFLASVG